MGLGRMMLLGDIGQQLDIGDLEREVQSLRDSIQAMRSQAPDGGGAAAQMAALRNDIDELRLYIAVLVRLLGARDLIPREQFQRVFQALDASDGTVDGKLTHGLIAP